MSIVEKHIAEFTLRGDTSTMRGLMTVLVGFFLFVGFFYFFIYEDNESVEEQLKSDRLAADLNVKGDNEEQNNNSSFNSNEVEVVEGLHQWIGQSEEDLIEYFGEPSRIDMSQYGYEWWIYKESSIYLQFGVGNNVIVSVYTNDASADTAHIRIGDTYDEVMSQYEFKSDVSLRSDNSSYKFELREDDLKMRPLAPLGNVWVQFYFDTHTEKLSSIRYIDEETLLLHRPYSIVYRGKLPEVSEHSENEWGKIQEGQALQIFDLTNDIRKNHELPPVEWDETTAYVALLHSEDMNTNNFFSHTSPNSGELKDRLESEFISYQLAAENIAANYVDAIEAVEGWLNSEGHRVNLLDERFTHLGVGVYRNYYTQNFIVPW
ncbi:CAP-associated domain-containing protein [Evansella sp. AB-P1]|uniref:CAP domain-containing protein n=1 Tax=Evansella sp. AB-P1 TaxID=3037653 RepID=UPI00241F9D54|nr:CAP domain-containing protein [Evansella sp. AB-P1]MDG5788320.1 CAP-associated domain-containing protein [Evansella sp. AB-P1]